MAQNRVAKRMSPFPNPPTPSHAVTASPSPSPGSSIPHCLGETHGPGCTTPHCRTAGAEPGATGRTASILHGDVHCLFHNTSQLSSQTLLEGSLLAGSPWPPPGLVAGKQTPISQGTPSFPPWHGAGRHQLSCEERAALSCPRVEDV